MANQRILRATSASLSWQPQGSDGEAANPGTVTVGVTRADGTTVKAAGTATVGTTTDPRTVALTAAETASLDRLTATWTVSGTTVAVTYHEIVGGFLFTRSELRAKDGLSSVTDYPNATLDEARTAVEDLFLRETGQSFVPRFDVDRVSDIGFRFGPTYRPLRSVRWVRQFSDYTTPTYTDYTTAEVGQVVVGEDGWAILPYSTSGYLSVQIGYEHGHDSPSGEAKRHALTLARYQLLGDTSGISPRARSITNDFGNLQYSFAGPGHPTGLDEVDAFLVANDIRPLVG